MTQPREKRPPNRQPRPLVTPGEQEHLLRLYTHDAAWTRSEAVSFLGEARFREFVEDRLLGRQDTLMGPMYHLLSRGRRAAFDLGGTSYTLTRQLDDAYVRLCMKDLGWQFISKQSPFYKGFNEVFHTLRFREAHINTERVMLGGRLSGGGYSSQGIERLMRQVKSTALSRNIPFVILTPQPRAGQVRAAKHDSILRLVHHLPRVDGGTLTRFNPVAPFLETPDSGPVLTPTGLQWTRGHESLPNLTLEILQLKRKERIERAQAAIEVDWALSEAQLGRYYGLSPSDLTGRLETHAILRPGKNRGALEVQQRIVVADRKAARLDDGDLNHRLTTAQLRHDLGAPADPKRWTVEEKSALKLEEPDAVYITDDRKKWAIEADTGQYHMPTILRKLQTFQDQEYDQTVWGTPSHVRVRNLTDKIPADLRPILKLTEWW